ncbi:hypothetical protein CCACVL1_02689 [Corchorus capsularis]|uniref:Uncharacterized protein n=1 Tax=Corchorus capsularis TaxID=210143 RepID=A0A1R3K6W2_COCAP|nr:hypothetical protein CCACVL1_02689 [Corchorus capsularis]
MAETTSSSPFSSNPIRSPNPMMMDPSSSTTKATATTNLVNFISTSHLFKGCHCWDMILLRVHSSTMVKVLPVKPTRTHHSYRKVELSSLEHQPEALKL